MPRKTKAAAATQPLASNVSVVLLQRAYTKLQRQLEQAQDTRAESEAEEALETLRDTVHRALPALRAWLGQERVEDSIAKYDAFRALDDLSDAACMR